MANEKRLIDANRLKRRIIAFETAIKRDFLSIESIIDIINTEQTVDAVEVVRCKDCKSYNGHRYCNYLAEAVLDGDFCSYGERRTDGKG